MPSSTFWSLKARVEYWYALGLVVALYLGFVLGTIAKK